MAKHKLLDIIFEDDDLIVLNKPALLLAVPDRFDENKPNLYRLLSNKLDQVFIVHRIDKETSGLICFAKNEESLKNLSTQFEERIPQKTYLALADGRILKEEGMIDKPISTHPFTAGKMMVNPKGKPSLTSYKVLEKFKKFTLVEVELHTGRTHQIRVHFHAIGHPLAIDPLYHSKQSIYLSEIKKKNFRLGKEKEEKPLISRTTLHAWKLSLMHPSSGAPMNFEAPLPKDLRALINQLEKWAR